MRTGLSDGVAQATYSLDTSGGGNGLRVRTQGNYHSAVGSEALMHKLIFTVSITGISRILVLRDRVLGRIGPGGLTNTSEALATRHTIQSGNNTVDAVFVLPVAGPTQAVVLICHGIGEIVEHWLPVQQLLAANGTASLVFDYSGYGKSTGRISASQCEDDTIAAFQYLQLLTPSSPVSLLGFSLGSGIAAAIVRKVAAHRLVLCAAFTSFRAAGRSLGIPRYFAKAMPDLWQAREVLRGCTVPVLIVHGEKDRLVPVKMAAELADYCGREVELVIVPELAHNEPFYRPSLAYWGLILSRLIVPQGDGRISTNDLGELR